MDRSQWQKKFREAFSGKKEEDKKPQKKKEKPRLGKMEHEKAEYKTLSARKKAIRDLYRDDF